MLGESSTIALTITQTKRSTPRRKGCPANHVLKKGGGLERERRHLPGLGEKVTKVAMVVPFHPGETETGRSYQNFRYLQNKV